MKTKITLLLLLIGTISNAQSIARISNKIADEICSCISTSSKDISATQAYKICEDQTLNMLNTILTKEEFEIAQKESAMNSIRKGLFLTVNQNCTYLQQAMNPNSRVSEKKEEFPIGVKGTEYPSISNYEQRTITIEGTITKVVSKNKETYFLITSEKQTLLARSMIISGFEKKGNKVKLMGKITPIAKQKSLKKIQKNQTHQINVYGIVNSETLDFAYFPGTEHKVSAWRNGSQPY